MGVGATGTEQERELREGGVSTHVVFKMGGSGTCFSMDGDVEGGGEGMVGDAGCREGGLDIEDLKAGQRLEGVRS